MSTTQDELKNLSPLMKQIAEKRQKENEQFAEDERKEMKIIETVRSKAIGLTVTRTAGGYILIVKTAALVGNAIATIYDFWRRQFGTPLAIVVSDDPAKTKLELRSLEPKALKKTDDIPSLVVFKKGEVSETDILLFRDYARRRFNRPVLTITLDNVTDLSVLEMHQ